MATKRKASDDSSDDAPSTKRQKGVRDPSEEGEIQDEPVVEALVAENASEAQEEQPVRILDAVTDGHTNTEAATAQVVQPGENDNTEQQGSAQEAASPPVDEEIVILGGVNHNTANLFHRASFRIGSVVYVPLIHPYLNHDKLTEKVVHTITDEDFQSRNIGTFRQSLTPAVVVALHESNMMVLPVLDGSLNSEREKRKQANLNMSLDLVRAQSKSTVPDDEGNSQTKLMLKHDFSSEDEDAWQPAKGAHVHFGKPQPVEYHWPNKEENSLTTMSTKILVERYAFVHGTLLNVKSSKNPETALVKYIKQENIEYCKQLEDSATPVAPPPAGIDEDAAKAPPADAGASSGSDADEDDDEDPGQGGSAVATAKKTSGKTRGVATGKPGASGDKAVKKPVKKVDADKPAKTNKSKKDKDNGNDDPDSETDNAQPKPFKSGKGVYTRKVKVNGKVKWECGHDCHIKFRQNVPCGHPCCRNGLHKAPVRDKKKLQDATDGKVLDITISEDDDQATKTASTSNEPKKSTKSAEGKQTQPKSKSKPKPGTAIVIKKDKSKRQLTPDSFVNDGSEDEQSSPPKTPETPTKEDANPTKKQDGKKLGSRKSHPQLDAFDDIAGGEISPPSLALHNASLRNQTSKSDGKGSTVQAEAKKKKASKTTASQQGSSKASTAAGISKASGRSTRPIKNTTRSTSYPAKTARSGSGSAAASTATKKPAGSKTNTRSASSSSASGKAATKQMADNKGTTKATSAPSAAAKKPMDDDGKTKTRSASATSTTVNTETQQATNGQAKTRSASATSTTTTAAIKQATDGQAKTRSASASSAAVADKPRKESEDMDNLDQEILGLKSVYEPNDSDDKADKEKYKPEKSKQKNDTKDKDKENDEQEKVNNQTPMPEVEAEEDEDPWAARSEALAADRPDIHNADAGVSAMPPAASINAFTSPLSEYLGDAGVETEYLPEDDDNGPGFGDYAYEGYADDFSEEE